MKFSILIANYNNGNYFVDCYNSIVAQTYDDWEAIIVDDCSTDDSVEQITVRIKDDNRFRLVKNSKNEGCGYTKRKCAELATGEICGFLDPDDTILSDAIELMMEVHRKHPGVSLVHSSFNYCNEKMERISAYTKGRQLEVNEKFVNLGSNVNPFASFKKSFYVKNIGIDPALKRAVDQDLYLKLSETGPFYFLDKVLYNYRIHSRGISIAKADEALYWYLKVIMSAEKRRGVDLEEEAALLLNRTNPQNMEINLGNPRFLILAMVRAFRKSPAKTLKKLLLNRY